MAPPGAEGVFLNQNLAVYPTFILRDFHAYFLSTLLHRLFDLIDEPRYRLRLVKCYNDMLDGVGARTRACRQLSQIIAAARWTAARKFCAVLS